MTSQASPAGPGQLVDLLTRWATDTAWVEWLELGGSLGRGADDATRRQWTFLACIAAGDALKHAARGRVWRALRSLNEARDLYLQLLAARAELIFPQFGAVSLENAGESVPAELATTLVSTAEPAAIAAGVRALVDLLAPFVAEHDLDQLLAAVRPPLRADR